MWYNNTLEDYVLDIALANQLLDEAGYRDTDNDGVREMPDGTNPLILRLQWPNDAPEETPRIAELLEPNVDRLASRPSHRLWTLTR